MPGVKMQVVKQEEKHVAELGVKLNNNKNRKGWAKGKMEGKGGPLNPACTYRGVRQRQWGMWVAEIREPGKKKRLWLGTYHTADEAALIYDRASRQFYGPEGYQNLCDFPGKHDANLNVPRSNSERQQQIVARRLIDERPVATSSTSRLGAGGSGQGSSSSTSGHHLRPIRPDYNGQSNFLVRSCSGVDSLVGDDFNATARTARFDVSPMAASAAGPSSTSDFLTQEALWRLQMESEMKTEGEEELTLDDCWSDCSASVTSAPSPDSRDVGSSCLTMEEEPAWDNFPEILSLPSDLQLLDEKNLIYFPKLV